MRLSLFGTRNGNRTHNYPLGGGYYIHLTMQADKPSPIVAQKMEKIKCFNSFAVFFFV